MKNFQWIVFLVVFLAGNANASSDIWTYVNPAGVAAKGTSVIVSPRSLVVDMSLLRGKLQEAPDEETVLQGAVLDLPMPDGEIVQFNIERSSVMASTLANRYPDIQTYRGFSVKNRGTSVRLDLTPQGFHALVTSPKGTVYIEPSSNGGDYHSYYRKDYYASRRAKSEDTHLNCGVEADEAEETTYSAMSLAARSAARSGGQIRTFRLAMAATGEYVNYHGGTKAAAMAAIVTTVNRLNVIMERDLAIRFELVDNNDSLIYTDSDSDPYTNDDPSLLLSENQRNIDIVIGRDNYDIGHTLATFGGGLAYVRALCVVGHEARAASGYANPVAEPYFIELVAHEMGHQLGSKHSFNGTSGSCGGGNRHGTTAYEPGSGSTIMSYAGICGSENTQDYNDPIYHSSSIEQIQNHLAGVHAQCGSVRNTGNTPPTVNAGIDYNIPKGTAFILTGSASDTDNSQTLSYQWEEMDAGLPTNAQTYGTDLGSNPLFRSFMPMSTASRTFPRMADLLSGVSSQAETLPTTGRNLNFRLTVRDGAGGVNEDDVVLSVSNLAGPFSITYPNNTVVLDNRKGQRFTWNVAETSLPPVNCSTVDVYLSTDGGNTFPLLLADDTNNDGYIDVRLPAMQDTDQARIKIQCSDNIFFDISDRDFHIRTNTGLGSELGIRLNLEAINVLEGESQVVKVSLNKYPASNVVLTVSTDVDGVNVGPVSLIFTPDNWFAQQPITVTASEDINEVGESGLLTVTVNNASSDDAFDGLNKNALIQVTDNEPANSEIDKDNLSLTEGGQGDFTVSLTSEPASTVVFNVVSSDSSSVSVFPARLTFTSLNWRAPQTVQVIAEEDANGQSESVIVSIIVDTFSSDDRFDSLPAKQLIVSVLDNDTAEFEMSANVLGLTEGRSGIFTVVLKTQPLSNVVLNVSDAWAVNVYPSSLVFTPGNWNIPKSVQIFALEDDDSSAETTRVTLSVNASLSDDTYDSLANRDVLITIVDTTDIDTGTGGSNGFTANPSTLYMDAGASKNFAVVLTARPFFDVVFNVVSTDTDLGTVGTSKLTFTSENWDSPQSVTVSTNRNPDDLDTKLHIQISVNTAESDAAYSAVSAKKLRVKVDYADLLYPGGSAPEGGGGGGSFNLVSLLFILLMAGILRRNKLQSYARRSSC